MTDPRLEIRKRFEATNKVYLNVARCHIALHLESLELQELTEEQKILKLTREYELSNQEMDAFPRKEYLDFDGCESHHFNTFFSQYFLNHSDEEPELLNGHIVSKKNAGLKQLLEQSKLGLPAFTFQDFKSDQANVVFYELAQRPPRTSKQDYHRMRDWQVRKKVDCVNLQLNQFIERFYQQLQNQCDLADYARKELELLNELRQASQYSCEQFFAKLTMLKAIDPDSLPEGDIEFHQFYCKFLRGSHYTAALNPTMLRTSLQQIRLGKLSPVPLSGWSLIKYRKWLIILLDGKTNSQQFHSLSCEQLFEQTYRLGQEHVKRLIAEFEKKYSPGEGSKKKYKAAIFNEINRYRLKYNQLDCLDYYHFLPQKQILKYHFINNCFLEIDLEHQMQDLHNSIVIHKMVRFFKHELYLIDQCPVNPFQNYRELKNNLADLITIMVPDADLINQLWRLNKSTARMVASRKPFLFIAEDLKEAIRSIFNKAFSNLNHLLDQKPGNLLAIYAIQQIKDLDLRALTAQDNDLNLNEYFDKVKDVFKIRLQYVENMEKRKAVNLEIPYESTIQKNQPPEESLQPQEIKLSFGCKKSPGYLVSFVQALNHKIDFLDDRTSIEEFIRMVTSDDLLNIEGKIYLGCRTKEFKYLLKHFKSFFKSFNPATIGKSGLFISNLGNPITSESLYNSNCENLQSKIAIDTIFNQKH